MPYRVSRRDLLSLAGGVIAGGVLPGAASAQPAAPSPFQPVAEGQAFEPAGVVDVARQLARRPYAAPPNDLPEEFARLSFEQYAGIRARPETLIWAGEGRGFRIEPLHRGFVYANPVALFIVEDGTVRRIVYDRNRFDFGRVAAQGPAADIGYSGIRLQATQGGGAPFDFAVLQGASFFRALARGQTYGVVSRALTLKPAETRGEEFPLSRAFWIERPAAGSTALVLHALLDTESASGAARMTFRPGDMTIIDVELTLFPRVNLDHVGLGAMASTYLFGPNDRRNVDDARPAVHDSTGLRMLTGGGEWLWRPLQNPETLQLSAFVDRNPRGFGLVQRERDPAHFQDDEQRWETRPTLWTEPLGEWGQGVVQLIEIPSDSEINDNVLAYWRPRAPVPAGSEYAVAYRQFWGWGQPERPPLATVSTSLVGRGSQGRRRRFIVDFAGDELGAPLPDMRPILSTSPGSIQGLRVWPYPERKTIRVGFELDPGNENACEMRLLLEAGGKPITETWLYRWTP
ncbi:MAG TPA: glucan biosynthesis protein D [Beijerinckiaceae bacterium]